MHVWEPEAAAAAAEPAFEPPPTIEAYTSDLSRLIQICGDAAVNSFCHRRLQKLQARFQLHLMDNGHHESAEQRACPHRDFYNIRKVDTPYPYPNPNPNPNPNPDPDPNPNPNPSPNPNPIANSNQGVRRRLDTGPDARRG